MEKPIACGIRIYHVLSITGQMLALYTVWRFMVPYYVADFGQLGKWPLLFSICAMTTKLLNDVNLGTAYLAARAHRSEVQHAQ